MRLSAKRKRIDQSVFLAAEKEQAHPRQCIEGPPSVDFIKEFREVDEYGYKESRQEFLRGRIRSGLETFEKRDQSREAAQACFQRRDASLGAFFNSLRDDVHRAHDNRSCVSIVPSDRTMKRLSVS